MELDWGDRQIAIVGTPPGPSSLPQLIFGELSFCVQLGTIVGAGLLAKRPEK
jgi:hypothetical protein